MATMIQDLPNDYDTPQAAFSFALELVQKQASTAYPDEAKRIADGIALIHHGHVTLCEGYALIKSATSDVVHRVNGTCECKAAGFHAPGYHCSHRWAKTLLRKALGILDTLWCATYQDAIGFACETRRGTFAFFAEGDTTYTVLFPTSPHLVLGAKVTELMMQAQRDGALSLKHGQPQYKACACPRCAVLPSHQ